jgi:radical SAM-linked protein
VQRLRIRFAKRGRLRFTSHRDFQRAFERAIRRAQVPIAHSAGFNPHPKISYAGAAPTGAASEAEYLEIALTQQRDPEQIRLLLDDALPDGLDILQVVPAREGKLADRLHASDWQIELPGIDPGTAQDAVDALLSRQIAEVQRMTKKGLRTVNVRDALLSARVADRVAQVGGASCAILHVVVRHTTPAVRPDDVLTALRSQADLAPPSPPRMTRLAQGPLDGVNGAVTDPLVPETDAVGA